MSNPLHPDDGIIISRKWLEENLQPDRAKRILENSQPLKPVLEVAWESGYVTGIALLDKDKVKENFLNNPIEIKN